MNTDFKGRHFEGAITNFCNRAPLLRQNPLTWLTLGNEMLFNEMLFNGMLFNGMAKKREDAAVFPCSGACWIRP
jgi:hypothetical protein